MLVVKQIGMGFESTFGTPATIDKYLKVRGCDIETEETIVETPSLTTKFGAVTKHLTERVVRGVVPSFVYPDDLGYWLKLALGGVSSALASGESLVYNHTFTQTDDIPSATFVRDEESQNRRATGLKLESMRIGATTEMIDMTCTLIGQDTDTTTSFTPTSTDIEPFIFSQASLRFGNTIDLALLADQQLVDSWNIEYTNSLVSMGNIDQRTTSLIKSQSPQLSGSFQIYSEDETYESLLSNGTEKALVLDITGATIGNGSNYKVRFLFPKMYFTKVAKPYSVGDIIVERLEFKVLFDTVENYAFKAVVTNLLTNYN